MGRKIATTLDRMLGTKVGTIARSLNCRIHKELWFPQNFLVDPQGKIIAKSLHGKQLEEKLKELFSQELQL